MLEEDDYPPYPSNVVQMTREAKEDERRGMQFFVPLMATIIAACAAAGLMVAYGWF